MLLKLLLCFLCLVDSLGKCQIDYFSMLQDILLCLFDDSIDSSPEAAGCILLLLRVDNVLIGEGDPLLWSH